MSAPLKAKDREFAFAKALEAAPTAGMPLDVGRRTEDAVHTSSTALVAERLANATDEVDIE
jgi:hypothetical protein